jgi:hypothetical protein
VPSSPITKIKTNKKVAFVLFDLKKAFDFINHDILLLKVKHYGIRALLLLWLCSFLSNRTQKVEVNDLMFCPFLLLFPKALYLVLLFILFINDVFQFNLLTVNSIYMLMILLLFLLLMMSLNYNHVLTISLLSTVVGVCTIV